MSAASARTAMYPPPGMVGPRLIAAWSLRTRVAQLDVDGLAHVPVAGPVLLIARHYHHLLDGAALVARVKRPVHIVVALDWAADAAQRRWMERACRFARYPVILRPATTGSRGGYDAAEVGRYLRAGMRDAATLLSQGRVVLVFPEGYPVVDPTVSDRTPRARDADGMLPFAAGYRTIVELARRLGARDIAIVPIGFRYARAGAKWRVAVRFGPPLRQTAGVGEVERAVRELSR